MPRRVGEDSSMGHDDRTGMSQGMADVGQERAGMGQDEDIIIIIMGHDDRTGMCQGMADVGQERTGISWPIREPGMGQEMTIMDQERLVWVKRNLVWAKRERKRKREGQF